MKITFVGTSHGAPSAERFCSCTMIEIGKAIYIIDAGAPVADCLLCQGKDINDIKAVFLTHIHSDHSFGLFYLVRLMNWYYKKSSADFYIPEQQFIDMVVNVASSPLLDTERLRLKLIDLYVAYKDKNIKVEYIPILHMGTNHNTYALLITAEGKRLLFSGDFSGRLNKNDVPSVISEEALDLFVCEMAHFGIEELTPYLDTCKAKRVYFNHVFPLDKYGDIEAARSKYAFEIGGRTMETCWNFKLFNLKGQ